MKYKINIELDDRLPLSDALKDLAEEVRMVCCPMDTILFGELMDDVAHGAPMAEIAYSYEIIDIDLMRKSSFHAVRKLTKSRDE